MFFIAGTIDYKIMSFFEKDMLSAASLIPSMETPSRVIKLRSRKVSKV